ncbi:MAG: Hsp20/alpha crystallin family protein [Myxococcota bacterium]
MTLTHWDPFAEMQRLRDGLRRETRSFRPAVDIHEDEASFRLDLDVPGIDPGEIEVGVEKNVLTIAGERTLQRDEEKGGYRRVERAFGSFSRSFTLPETVDADAIEAKASNGMLTITLPKKAAPETSRKVAVHAD